MLYILKRIAKVLADFKTVLTPGCGNVTSVSVGRPHNYIPMAHDGKKITALVCVHCQDMLADEAGDGEKIKKILREQEDGIKFN